LASDAESRLEALMARRQARGKFAGWPVRSEILALDRSLGVFNGNAEDLEEFLRAGSQLPEARGRRIATSSKKSRSVLTQAVSYQSQYGSG
jgi:hypothetical protein